MGGYVACNSCGKYGGRLRALISSATRAAADTERVALVGSKWPTCRRMGQRRIAEGWGQIAFPPARWSTRPQLMAEVHVAVCRKNAAGSHRGRSGAAWQPARRASRGDAAQQFRLPNADLWGPPSVISPPAEMRAIASRNSQRRIHRNPRRRSHDDNGKPNSVNAALIDFLSAL